MKRMKSSLVLAALWLGLLGVTGCANLQQPAQAEQPAQPAHATEQVQVFATIGGMQLTVYHPDTRTLYVWMGDPRPGTKRPLTCTEIQLSDNPSSTPKSQACPR